MPNTRWFEKRKPYWDRLEVIVAKAQRRGLRGLSARELQELGLLYRQAAADLSTLREDSMSARLAGYLNQLLGRAHNLIYMGRRARPRGIWRFYRKEFPETLRANLAYAVAALALFLVGALVGFLACLGNPAFERFFLGAGMADTIERREMWTHSILSIKPLASSSIMTNNLVVSFFAFSTGIVAGLGTLYLLVFNGLLFGVISAACWQAGMSREFWSFVAPHGVLELPAVFIAGAAGLLVCRGILFPGFLPRRDALVHYGGQGVRLMLGIVPVLVVAGIVEGFYSPSSAPTAAKFLFALGAGGLLAGYLARAGASERSG
jgi:uncharacterized membrane protein SpoIIM required for sporulation